MPEESKTQRHIGGDNVPIPDPSLLTTEQIKIQISGLRELLETRLSGSERTFSQTREILEARLDGMDKATELIQSIGDRLPEQIHEKLLALRELLIEKLTALQDTHGEKFSSIQTQFKERDTRSEQSSKDSKVAVDAALQAAKEAVGEQNKSSAMAIAKSEASTTKQIDQLQGLINSNTKTFDDKIADVKDRLTRIEGMGQGSEHAVESHQASGNYMVAIVGVIVAVLIGLAGIAIALLRK